MKFFTLIHIAKGEQSIHNNSLVKSFDDQINLYFTCAKQLHLSLKPTGIELVILTNNKEFLERLNVNRYNIDIIELGFTLNVPSGVKFFSAHYKIEIYNYLSELNEAYIGLIDCDVICVNNIPECFTNCINNKLPIYYDITDQIIPAYGLQRIINDKERLSNTKSVGLWAGGEFIAGPPNFFKTLYNEIKLIKEAYFNNFSSFKHQGDEMLTSVAIENLKVNGEAGLLDAGALSIIGRFWSPTPLHVQKPLKGFEQHFLLHLPSDKKFIAKLKADELKGVKFFSKYKSHFIRARLLERAIKGIKPYLKKRRKMLAKSKSAFI